jgi:hypothetical protein
LPFVKFFFTWGPFEKNRILDHLERIKENGILA